MRRWRVSAIAGGLRRGWRAWVIFIGVLVLATAGLYAARGAVQQAHVVLVYLLIILGGSAYGGRALGLLLAALGFLSIDYFFQAPFGLLSVGNGPDWFVLVTFLITALVAANLLARAQAAAERERGRSEEVERLSRLGAELLGSGTAATALGAIAEKARETVGAEAISVFRFAAGDAGPALELLASRGSESDVDPALALRAAEREAPLAVRADGAPGLLSPPASRPEGARPEDAGSVRALLLPLRVHDRIAGVLAAESRSGLRTDDASLRLLDALTYYTALAVERMTLVAEAEHAEALRESDRVREALLASISHDLRTPLSTIKLLAQSMGESERQQHHDADASRAAVIEEQADRLSRLVTNLLDLTRLRSSAFQVHPEINAAEDLVGAVARQVMGILGDHALERQSERNGPVLLGRFDFVQSQRILVNLIENAARYSPDGAPIAIAVTREGNWLCFRVVDRGPGIAASERRRIFEAFYRAPASAADVGGVGLGLYIGRALAEAQGGSLGYEPQSEGGSTFVLRLPASDEAPELEGAGAESGSPEHDEDPADPQRWVRHHDRYDG